MLNIEAVANKLNMTESGIRKLIQAGEIRYYQHGKRGRIKFDPAWVEEFVERNTHNVVLGNKHQPPTPAMRPYRKKKAHLPDNREGGLDNPHGFNWDLLQP